MSTTNSTTHLQSDAKKTVDTLAAKANDTLSEAEKFATERAHALRDGIAHARAFGSEKLGAAADAVRRGIDRTVDTASSLADKCDQTSKEARVYIKDQPLKAVLMAAVAGAALTLLVTALSRRRH